MMWSLLFAALLANAATEEIVTMTVTVPKAFALTWVPPQIISVKTITATPIHADPITVTWVAHTNITTWSTVTETRRITLVRTRAAHSITTKEAPYEEADGSLIGSIEAGDDDLTGDSI